MRIHSLTISNVRGIEQLELAEVPDHGVFVISGDNEQGKSTMLFAIQAVLTIDHGSQSKEARSLKPVDRDVAPEVELHATIGDYEFRIKKRWLKTRASQLTILAPRAETYTGRQADDQLKKILAENLDTDLFKASLLSQGYVEPAINAAGIPSLSSALNSQQGQDDGEVHAEDSALMNAARQRFEEFYTPKGSPKAALKQVRDQAEAAAAAHMQAVDTARELEERIENVGRLEEELRRANAALPQAEKDLAAKREVAQEAEATRLAARDAAARLDTARAEAKRTGDAVARRAEEKARVRSLTQEREALEVEAERAEAALKEEKDKVAQLTAGVDEARAVLELAKKAEAATREAAEAAAGVVDYLQLKQRVSRIVEAEKAVAGAKRAVPTKKITRPQVDELNDARQELSVAEATAAAQAAQLELTGPGSVQVDGQAVELDATVSLHDGTSIQIGEVTATFRAGASQDETATNRLAEARRAYEGLLSSLQVSGVDEARALEAETSAKEESLRAARAELSHLLADDSLAELREQLELLEATLAPTLAQGEPTLEGAKRAHCAALEEVAERKAETAHAEEAFSLREAELTPWRDSRRHIRAVEATTLAKSKGNELHAATQALHEAEEALATTTLEEQHARATQALHEAGEAAASAQEKQIQADPETAHALLAGAEHKVQSLKERIHSTREKMARMEAFIQQAEGADEAAAIAEAEEKAAARKLASMERRARAAKVLYETLVKHRDAARRRYAGPFTAELTALARPVFGADLDFELDSDLQIVSRAVDGVSVDVGALSGGAQEQLMILSRLAIARLAGRGKGLPVPVFIDDALGNTDENRLDRMGTVFSKVGQEGQVFILTCVPRRYDSVVGKLDYPIEDLKKGR